MTTSPHPDTPPPHDHHTTAMCSATTHSGDPCRFTARHITGLCVNHDPAFRDQQAAHRTNGSRAAADRRAARRASSTPSLDPWLLADRASIQALLDTVIRLELAGHLPAERTRNLLRALALASRNFDRPARQADDSSRARHNLGRYRAVRATVDDHLAHLVPPGGAAAASDHAPTQPNSTPPSVVTTP